MNKEMFAEEVAARLARAEQSMDQALGDAAALLSYLTSERLGAGLSLSYGHDVIEGTASASAKLTETRSILIAVHERLSVYQRHQRIVLGGSGLDKPPSLSAPAAGQERLRVVDAA